MIFFHFELLILFIMKISVFNVPIKLLTTAVIFWFFNRTMKETFAVRNIWLRRFPLRGMWNRFSPFLATFFSSRIMKETSALRCGDFVYWVTRILFCRIKEEIFALRKMMLWRFLQWATNPWLKLITKLIMSEILPSSTWEDVINNDIIRWIKALKNNQNMSPFLWF